MVNDDELTKKIAKVKKTDEKTDAKLCLMERGKLTLTLKPLKLNYEIRMK